MGAASVPTEVGCACPPAVLKESDRAETGSAGGRVGLGIHVGWVLCIGPSIGGGCAGAPQGLSKGELDCAGESCGIGSVEAGVKVAGVGGGCEGVAGIPGQVEELATCPDSVGAAPDGSDWKPASAGSTDGRGVERGGVQLEVVSEVLGELGEEVPISVGDGEGVPAGGTGLGVGPVSGGNGVGLLDEVGLLELSIGQTL